MSKKVWVYDIESLSNFFSYTGKSSDGEIRKFVICEDLGYHQYDELCSHLRDEVSGLVGFNNISYDYPVLHAIMLAWGKGKFLTARDIYNYSQQVIEAEWSAVNEWEVLIPQLDLFRIWHFNNKARSTSLKSLQIAIRYPNVQDMPFPHTYEITTEEEVEQILSYNLNDVESTEQFYHLTKDKIDLRRGLIKQYKLNCINFSDSKIGEQLVLDLYCKATGKNKRDVRKMRTYRKSINFKDCVFDYIEFKSDTFNLLLNEIKGTTVTSTKGAFSKSVIYKGFRFDFGTGGLHGCIKPGVYESDDNHLIIDSDVASLYPSIIVQNRLYPQHLGEVFCDVYENEIVKPRLEAKKNGDKIMADGFKLSANSIYGKSNDQFSFLMDSKFTMGVTLNGQLMLTMLAESLMDTIPDLLFLQANTDGISVKIRKEDEELYYHLCREWEKKTRLSLEHVFYEKMVIKDTNNYMALYMER